MNDTIEVPFTDGLVREYAKLDSVLYPASRGLGRGEVRVKAPAPFESLVHLLMFMSFAVILPGFECSSVL